MNIYTFAPLKFEGLNEVVALSINLDNVSHVKMLTDSKVIEIYMTVQEAQNITGRKNGADVTRVEQMPSKLIIGGEEGLRFWLAWTTNQGVRLDDKKLLEILQGTDTDSES